MITSKIPFWAVRLNALLAITLGIWFFLTSLYLWMRFHVDIPIEDNLREIVFVQKVLEHGVLSQSLHDWLAPMALAHRIAVTRLLMVIDFRFFGGQNHVIYLITWLSILTLVAVFARTFRSSYRSEPVLLIFVVGCSLIFLTSHTQLWNLINPINSSWYLAMAASALSICCITHKPTPPSALYLVTACLLAAIAAFSNFSGVLVWLLLPLLVALRSVRTGLLFAAVSGLFLALYLRGVTPNVPGASAIPDEPGFNTFELLKNLTLTRLNRVANIISKARLFLGSPLSISHPKAATALVMASILLLIAGWMVLLRRRWHGSADHSAWLETVLAMATLTLGVAIATQLGRVFFNSPTAPRYQTIVMTYWLCICGLVLFFGMKGERAKPIRRFASTTLCLAIAAILLINSPYPITSQISVARIVNQTMALGLLGVSDKSVYRSLYPPDPPESLAVLEPFFSPDNIASRADANHRLDVDRATECSRVKLTARPSRWPGISAATAQIKDRWSKLYRQIPVTSAQGKFIGFLTPVSSPGATQQSLIFGEEDAWEGFFRSSEILNTEVYLHFRWPFIAGSRCRLQT